MRGFRGGGAGVRTPPPEICQRWGLVWIFDGKERGSKGCFYLIIVFFSGSLRSPILYIEIHKCLKKSPSLPLQVQMVFPSLRSIYTRSLECAFPYLFFLKLHDFTPCKPKIFWGRTPRPPGHYDITITNVTMLKQSCVYLR